MMVDLYPMLLHCSSFLFFFWLKEFCKLVCDRDLTARIKLLDFWHAVITCLLSWFPIYPNEGTQSLWFQILSSKQKSDMLMANVSEAVLMKSHQLGCSQGMSSYSPVYPLIRKVESTEQRATSSCVILKRENDLSPVWWFEWA